jgi:uncharacterized protein YkwD
MLFRISLVLAALLPGYVFAQSLPQQVLERVNVARWENGQLPPLKGHAQLDAAANLHSSNMATRNFFMHCDPDTLTAPWDRMVAAGYNWNSAAENIAAASSTALGVMNQWMNSSGHRANILSTDLNEIGVGYAFQNPDAANVRSNNNGSCSVTASNGGGYQHYWTQNFGRRSGVYPLVIAREAYQTSVCNIDLYVYGSGFATQMRFTGNGGSTWTAWQSYSPNTLFNLVGAAGATVTVTAEIRNGGGTVRSASDSIRLASACGSGGGTPPGRVFAHGFEDG